MSLNTKQKRGSAISLGMPHRQWLAEPSNSIGFGDRLSLLKLCSSPVADIEPLPSVTMEYELPANRHHWSLGSGRTHYQTTSQRTHYDTEET